MTVCVGKHQHSACIDACSHGSDARTWRGWRGRSENTVGAVVVAAAAACMYEGAAFMLKNSLSSSAA